MLTLILTAIDYFVAYKRPHLFSHLLKDNLIKFFEGEQCWDSNCITQWASYLF